MNRNWYSLIEIVLCILYLFVHQPEFDSLHGWFINYLMQKKTNHFPLTEMSNNSKSSLTTGGWKKNSIRCADGYALNT